MNVQELESQGFKRASHRIYLSTGANAVVIPLSSWGQNTLAALNLPAIGIKEAIYLVWAALQAWDGGASGKLVPTSGSVSIAASGGIQFDFWSFGPCSAGGIVGSSNVSMVADRTDRIYYGRDLAMLSQSNVLQALSGVGATNTDGAAGHTLSVELFMVLEIWRQV